MAAHLTHRYIDATIRSLPAETQEDVRAELEASIADALDARREQGEDPAEAERAVLTELGDPAVLAAQYAERPLHLIGPRYYLVWLHLLRLLLAIIPAVAVVGSALAHGLAGADLGSIIGESLATGITAAAHLFFWVTLVFVILERTGTETGVTWSVDDLPEERPTGARRSDMIASLVFLALATGALVWDLLRGLAWSEGDPVQVLHPEQWPIWSLALMALLLAETVLAVVIHRRGSWSTGSAVANTALAVAFTSWALTLLGRGMLINPELLALLQENTGADPGMPRILGVILVVTIVGIAAWDIIDGWWKTARDSRR